MDYVRLGTSGLKVSRIGLGCATYGARGVSWRNWVLNESDSLPFFRQAVEAGITFFDTANQYSFGASEEMTGKALNALARRHDVVIATKVFSAMSEKPNDRGLSRKHIMAQIDGSLKRLGTDYVDLYQVHRFDDETPVEETMEALHDVVRAGKALYLGASSMSAWQFSKMNHVAAIHGWTRFVSMQPQYNLLYREEEREMIPCCLDSGVGVLPWSPLARGFLAGNRHRGGGGETQRSLNDPFTDRHFYDEASFAVVEEVSSIAAERGVKNTQVALAWLLSRPGVVAPIIGATKEHHIPEAVEALRLFLRPEEINRLEAPYRPRPVQDLAVDLKHETPPTVAPG